jgi:Redoxin
MIEGGIGIGDRAPAFELAGVEDEPQALGDPGEERATVVYWTCNHCPYAQAWHDRLIELARDYGPRGVRFLAVNSNDLASYPQDGPDAMRARVEADGGWPNPYLFDADQSVAKAFGAERTPDVFVFDSDLRLRYRGAPDADYEDPGLDAVWVREALDAVLEGREPERPETPPVGCTIKWSR